MVDGHIGQHGQHVKVLAQIHRHVIFPLRLPATQTTFVLASVPVPIRSQNLMAAFVLALTKKKSHALLR